MKDKGLLIIAIITILLFFLDLISTLLNGQLISYLESNPLYKYGGLFPIILLNIFMFGFLFWIYHKTDNKTLRFIIMYSLVAIATTRVFVIYNNIQLYLNPIPLETIKALGTEKLNQIKLDSLKYLLAINILPYINCMICWFLYKKDHSIIKLE